MIKTSNHAKYTTLKCYFYTYIEKEVNRFCLASDRGTTPVGTSK